MHGWVAFKLGDPTARNAGRLSINPMVHLDPIVTLMILIVHFGWAKPVPVNSYNLENPKKDLMLISLAGPLANMFLALISGILIRIILAGGLNIIPMTILKPLFMMIRWSLMINVALAFFNLIPIPPLDGSKILFGILPAEKEYIVRNLNQYGPFILLGLIFINPLYWKQLLIFIIKYTKK